MAKLATISINFNAKLEGLQAGLAAASKKVGSFLGKMESVSKVAGKALAPLSKGFALGTGFGIGEKLGSAITEGMGAAMSGINRIDELNDAAQRIGVATDSLSKLRYIADMTGSAAEDLDAALGKMVTNLGDSAMKATPTSAALEKLGLDATKLAQMKPDQAFTRISEALSQVQNPAERASLGMDIFGKASMKLMNTLTAGPEEFERLAQRADMLGQTVSQIDANKIGMTKDSMDDLTKTFEGLGNQLAVQLSPAIKLVADTFADWILSMGGAQTVVGGFVDGVVHGVAWIEDAVFSMRQAWAGWIAWAEEKWGKFLQFFGMGGEDLIADAKMIRDGLEAQLAEGSPGQKLINTIDEYKKSLDDAAKSAANVADENRKIGESLHASMSDDDKKLMEDLAKQADSLYEATRTPFEKYKDQLADIDNLLQSRLIDKDTAKRGKAQAMRDFSGGSLNTFSSASDLAYGSRGAATTLAVANRASRIDPSLNVQQQTLEQNKLQTQSLTAIAQAVTKRGEATFRL